MASTIDARLSELGIELPTPAAPAANYVPFIKSGNLVFISGQITSWNGEVQYIGRLGEDFGTDEGYQAARICGLNLLTQLRAACSGDLEKVRRVVKLGGFVNCTADFYDQPKVVNGASDLMVEVFGQEIGSHARFAVGAPSLPFGIAVEVDGVFEIS